MLKNGQPCRPRDQVEPGAVLEVEPGPAPLSDVVPDPSVRFAVIYEDSDLVVVDKPAGLVVHPARGHRSGTLVNGLLARPGFEAAPADPRDPKGYIRPGVVHRIDKDTSGLLVIAKTELARENLKQQLKAHNVERAYWALTRGVPKPARIETGFGRHPRSRLRFTSITDAERRAVTQVTVLEPLAGGRAALVECRLRTGRTHQIRVHLSEQTRTPLIGDTLYGGPPAAEDLAGIAKRLGRQALHARILGFVHPRTTEMVRFESPLPADMEQALLELREL